jgi:hypothetical protein
VNVDFNEMLSDRELNLEMAGVHWNLARLNLKLAEGMRLRADDLDVDHIDQGILDNLIAEGVAQRWTNESGGPHWVLVLDYFCHESDVRNVPYHWQTARIGRKRRK